MSRIRSKLKKRYLAFKAHPLTRHRPVAAMLRYMRFNISQSLFPGPRKFKWINDLSFYAQKGEDTLIPIIELNTMVDSIASLVESKYINASIGKQMGDYITENHRKGKYQNMTYKDFRSLIVLKAVST